MPTESGLPSRAGSDVRAAGPRDHETLKALLRERNQWPERVSGIDRTIVERFQRRAAVLVLDMCGFSRLTAKHGILFYLSMIVQMEDCARPAVANNGGIAFKQDADNLFALFHTPADAVEAALDIFLAFGAVNSVVPDDRDIRGSIGIGYGDLILPETPAGAVQDVFGAEMNLASRLGEDLACGSEILLSPAAAAALPPGKYLLESAAYDHQGLEVRCHRFLGRAGDDDEKC
jgi:class 3 adenylate cyclase